ncbi:MAG: Hsp70 family protein [Xenococcus sp. (in: cyanobacteria)]
MSYSIGIDLGTTNSVACVWRRGRPETLTVDGRATLPSAISVRDGNVLIGKAAKARALLEPTESVTSAKRHIGDGKTSWLIGNKTYTPIEVDALILSRLKEAASAFLEQPVTEAVITVPAYFNNNQKRDTKLAAEAAGFQVLQLLPEPTAAAISYGLDQGKDQTVLVYDLGGGTFDVSVLKVQGNRFSVVAVDGDFNLGGDDFDLLLAEHLVGLLQKQASTDLRPVLELLRQPERIDAPRRFLIARARLQEAAEAAKIELALSDTAQVTIPDILGTLLDEEITIKTYNRLIEPLVGKTITKIQNVLAAANLTEDDIDRVILVGGSTRNRLVKERVTEAVKEPFIAERVDEVVGQGAAIVAGYLSSPEPDLTPIEFYNVTPFSLGVCAYKGEDHSRLINSIIINKNSPVPCIESRPYQLRTQRNRNNQLDVYMLQGESADPKECLVLGKYIFSNITHVPGIPAIIDIEYGYDQSGIITVAASERLTGKSLPLTIEQLPDDMSWISGGLNSQQLTNQNPYNKYAGQQRIPGAVTDNFGNPKGTQYDLVANNAFADCVIAVLHLYTGEGFNFKLPEQALKEKGFKIHRWTRVPNIQEFTEVLEDACQLWLISDTSKHLRAEHLQEISKFFDSGRGVYIWGDNKPYYADANAVMKQLFNCQMSGNTWADKIVQPQTSSGNSGFISHLITTGLEYLYEGVTIATIEQNSQLQPLMYGSAGNLAIAIYDHDGKRAIVDGGFTRLFVKWDTAGTGRYVKNAAGWLVNYERVWTR